MTEWMGRDKSGHLGLMMIFLLIVVLVSKLGKSLLDTPHSTCLCSSLFFHRWWLPNVLPPIPSWPKDWTWINMQPPQTHLGICSQRSQSATIWSSSELYYACLCRDCSIVLPLRLTKQLPWLFLSPITCYGCVSIGSETAMTSSKSQQVSQGSLFRAGKEARCYKNSCLVCYLFRNGATVP